MELVDASAILPELKRRPGLGSWLVFEDGPKGASRASRKAEEKAERKAQAAAKGHFVSGAAGAGAAAAEAEAEAEAEARTGVGAMADDVPVKVSAAGLAAEAAADAALASAGGDPLLGACLASGLRHFKSWADVPPGARSRVRRSMFPPAAGSEEAKVLSR